jgi:hypothetical protein
MSEAIKKAALKDINLKVGDNIKLKGDEQWNEDSDIKGWSVIAQGAGILLDVSLEYEVVVPNDAHGYFFIKASAKGPAYCSHIQEIDSINGVKA